MNETRARQLLVTEARRLSAIHAAVDGDLAAGQSDADTRPASDAWGPDGAALLLEHEVEESLRVVVDDERAEVALALTRVDLGTYGSCVACGVAIPDERLELVPATRFCVACEAADERRAERGPTPVLDPALRVAVQELDAWDDDGDDDDVVVPGAEEDAVHTRTRSAR
ncbi:hypothetical protein HC251_14500 [Iamia sp. SCSIO 61187]|uniref:TraR/DksA family transcriptional regulator n=1 Tax=Iamia sp. SCSIO 61187 TaxID=2722752 RepID=UPI001C62E4C8|nr:TraR/DksA C4-type zinc finger protein [Iamia sp. SCSIO 61187]QYG93514.1 hypothetical protein HC251_14500 [Iamia sp. SCSIO 61187]